MKNRIDDVVIVKIGTNVLMERGKDGFERLDNDSIANICEQVTELRKNKVHIVLVLSAAISAGMALVGVKTRPNKDGGLIKLQSLASVGWRHVLNAVDAKLEDVAIGELLLTQHELCMTQIKPQGKRTEDLRCLRKFELSSSKEVKSVVAVTRELLVGGHVVAINENDAVASDEIKLGDNDTLAAAFAAQLKRSPDFNSVRLVMLSDVNGVYENINNPHTLMRTISSDDIDKYAHLAHGSTNRNGSGGMITKLEAASLALKYGVDEVHLANGRDVDVIDSALNKKKGTYFYA